MVTPVSTRADVLERLREAEAEIRALGVRRLALFGSFVRSEPRPDSDVDLLVEFAPGQKSFDRFMRLYDLLEERLARPVDVVTIEALSPYIGPHILAEAVDVELEPPPLTEVQRREILRRTEAYLRDPGAAIPLEDALEQIERALG